MSAAAVTIGLPVFNAERVIETTLRHLVAQDHEPLRVIVSDNASTDATLDICRAVVEDDPRFTIDAHGQNRGWQANFRHVLDRADSSLFMWIGADDRLAASYVRQGAAVLGDRPDLVGCVSRVAWTSAGQPTGEAPGTEPIDGDPATRVARYLRIARDNSRFYGLYRTEQLRASMPATNFYGLDLAIMAGTLRFGGHGRVDDVLLWRERTDPATYVRHIDQDAHGRLDRVVPFRRLGRELRRMGVPLNGQARRWLLARNAYEHLRYWSSQPSIYGRFGPGMVLPIAELARRRMVAPEEPPSGVGATEEPSTWTEASAAS